MASWQDEIRAQAVELFIQGTEAFRFLERDYGYTPIAQKLEYLNDFRDTQAELTYAGEAMGVTIGLNFSSGNLDVAFRKIARPRWYPDTVSAEELASNRPVFMPLYDLIRFQGAEKDPDLLLGDLWNLYESKCKKRNALLATNLRGVLDGLARATVRYGDAALRGDSSQFAAVKEYQVAHQYDYILPRYRPQPKQPPTAK
ncbi:MAG: hypothetical protein KGO05_12300 [Chloroflexota bacterium]|nr:hypothetical protein [Chloroflexota bacterium]